MSDRSRDLRDFRHLLDRTLEMIEGAAPAPLPQPDPGPPDPLPGLLDRCELLSRPRPPPPVRSVHHFACTGGTLICKALATAPGTVLFSEIDPLSRHHLQKAKRPFFPTDLIADLHCSPRDLPDRVAIAAFRASLVAIRDELARDGCQVVLRDHTHSRYCLGDAVPDRPGLRDLIAGATGPALSIVTLRHPLDSYLSLRKNGWVHFRPASLQEYCRRYAAFLDDHADLPVFRYEEFAADPDTVLGAMSKALDLPVAAGFGDLLDLFRLSGDSGRTGARIAPRPRREIPDAIAEEARAAPGYAALCDRMGYADRAVPGL